MWSYLTRSFISPLPGYVENKAGDVESGLGLDEIALVLVRFDHIAGFVRPRQTARRVTVSREWIGLRTLVG